MVNSPARQTSGFPGAFHGGEAMVRGLFSHESHPLIKDYGPLIHHLYTSMIIHVPTSPSRCSFLGKKMGRLSWLESQPGFAYPSLAGSHVLLRSLCLLVKDPTNES